MLTNLPAYLAYGKKAVINAIGFITTFLALGILPDPYNKYAAGVLAVLTAISHFFAANAPAPGNTPAAEELDPVPEDEDPGAEVPDEFKPSLIVTASQVASSHQISAPPTE